MKCLEFSSVACVRGVGEEAAYEFGRPRKKHEPMVGGDHCMG